MFCFPYAGGSATLFRDWPPLLPDDVELVGIQLPGRAFRLKDPAFTEMPKLLDAIEAQVSPHLDEIPYVFWGHSMGALLSFELMRRYQAQGRVMPRLAILSARRAPHLTGNPMNVGAMTDDEFIDELRKMGGTPDEIIDNKRLMNLVLPSLRADFEILYNWEHQDGPSLKLPLRVVGGLADTPIAEADLQAWDRYTEADCSTHMFAGDHFYLHDAQAELLPWLSDVLSKLQV